MSKFIKRLLAQFAVILSLTLLLPNTVFGWGATGHKVIARIAWENMKATT